jgi:large repetitive protein
MSLDRNGIQATAEPGIAGVVVNLSDGTGNFLNTVNTDSNGGYIFSGLGWEKYIVEFIAPSGFDFTLSKIGGDPNIDGDAMFYTLSTGRTDEIDILVDGHYDWVGDAGLINQVPIPPALLLLGSGMLGVLGIRRFKK